MSEMKAVAKQSVEEVAVPQQEKRKWTGIELVGLVLVVTALLVLLISPGVLAGLFNSVVDSVYPIVVDVFLTGTVGVAIIVSVIIGRTLERLGFTDALMRVFIPLTKLIKINSSVVIPSIYNILGDINAAGKIAGPILVRAGATKDEQKIAVATMVQSQQSFATFMLGMVALTAVGANAFIIVVLAVFIPVIVVPFLLSKTIYRNTKAVQLEELPKFTPNTRFLPTLFNAAREGAELLFLLIIPAVAVVFAMIGVLEYAGIWSPIESGLSSILLALRITVRGDPCDYSSGIELDYKVVFVKGHRDLLFFQKDGGFVNGSYFPCPRASRLKKTTPALVWSKSISLLKSLQE
jgi:hypothetical protein